MNKLPNFRVISVISILSILISSLGMSTRVAQAAGNTYYVDKTVACSDAWPGSLTQPFCTITRGAAVARAGDTVNILNGTYAETVYLTTYSGTEGNPITFHAEPGVTMTGNSAGFGSAFAVSTVSYIVIDGFNVTETKYKGIYVDSSNHITLSNNHVTYAGINQGPNNHNQGIYLRNTTYSTITGNVTDHNSCIGIWLVNHSDYNTISNNVSFGNTSTVAYPTVVVSDAAGIDLTGSSNNTIINNTVYANEDSGINLYIFNGTVPSSYNLVVGNLIYGNGDHGIDNNNSPYNTLVSNTVQGNGTVGVNFEGEASAGSHHGTAINNIIVGNGFTPPTGSFGGNLRVDLNSTNGTTLDYNIYDRQSAAVQIIWNNVDYASLAAFRTAVPTQEVHGLEGDPLLANPAPSVLRTDGETYLIPINVGDYTLMGGSPAIDSANADAPSEPEFDIVGNNRIDDPGTVNTGVGVRTYDDRGAYEFLPSGPSLPVVTTQSVTDVTMMSATGNGTISALGAPNPTQHGVVWSTSPNPTIADSKTEEGPVGGTGAFTSSITGLEPGTLYHVRAYATNDVGTAYGQDVTFTTLLLPAVTTQAVTSIGQSSAVGNGNVTTLGVPNPTQHGVVWSTSPNPTTADNKTEDGPLSATGPFTSVITGLAPATLYHVRAYATNTAGTVYGDDVSFTTLLTPTVSTQAVTSITTTTATGNGTVNTLGIPDPTQHGVCWSTSANPTTSNNHTSDGPVSATGPFTSSITGLTPGTEYHVRAYATNAAGTVYGEDVVFTTLLTPTVTTQTATDITTMTATGNGTVTVLGSSNPTQHGVVWSTSPNPTLANNKTEDGPISATGPFTSSITGLTPGTLYHVRAYATNTAGTSYGNDITFTTLLAPTVTTQAVTDITTTTATGNGNVTVLGIPNPTQHGVVWSTSPNPTTADNKTMDGPVSATGSFTSSMTGLALGMQYHVRAYVTNAVDTVYGNEVVFTTLPSSTSTTTPAAYPAMGANVSGIGTAVWQFPNYVIADDTNYATVSLNNTTSQYLEGTNYGFAIPANASINGITVTIGRYESGASGVRDNEVRLVKAGVVTGSNKAATSTYWPTVAPAEAVYGSNSDLWGTTWTPDDINAGSFGVALSATSTINRLAYVDYMQVSVTYTVSTFSTTTTVDCGAGTPVVTYASSITCVATVARGAGSFTPTGTVTWTTNDNGSFATSPCALSGSDGSASCSVTYTPISVGSGSHQISAVYAGDANFFSSTGNQTITVNEKDASVTPNAASKVLGQPDPPLTGTLTGFLPADNITASYSREAGETVEGSPYIISATLSPTEVLANYNIIYNTANFTITPPPQDMLYDDGDVAWNYSGSWVGWSTPGPYLETLHYSYEAGAAAELAFNGRQIKLTYATGAGGGQVDVYVDEVKRTTLNQNSTDWYWQQTWTSDLLGEGSHSLRLVLASGSFITLDAVEVIVNPIILSNGVHDDASVWTYNGSWTPWEISGPYADTLHYSYSLGDSAQVAFTGQQIRLRYFASPMSGVMEVYVDGNKVATLDQSSPFWDWQRSWTSDLLGTGTHNLRLVYASVNGGVGFTSVDAIEVIETPAVLTEGTYDDGHAAMSYTGMWGSMTGVSGPYADTLHYSYYVGDSLQVAFSGRQFKLRYLTGTNAGSVEVYVDGSKVATLDQSSPSWGWQKNWTSDLLPAGTHNLRLVYASGAESFISLDAIEVIAVPVVLGAGTYDDGHAAFTYDGNWGVMTGVSGPSEGTLHYTYDVGDSVQVSFSGQQVELTYLGSPEAGRVDVYVDGIKVDTLDQTSEGWVWQQTWRSDELPTGDHSLRLVYTSEPSSWSFVNLDALTVDP